MVLNRQDGLDSNVDMSWVELASGQMRSTTLRGIRPLSKLGADTINSMSVHTIMGEVSLLGKEDVEVDCLQEAELLKYEPGSLLRDVGRLLSMIVKDSDKINGQLVSEEDERVGSEGMLKQVTDVAAVAAEAGYRMISLRKRTWMVKHLLQKLSISC